MICNILCRGWVFLMIDGLLHALLDHVCRELRSPKRLGLEQSFQSLQSLIAQGEDLLRGALPRPFLVALPHRIKKLRQLTRNDDLTGYDVCV